MLDGRNIILGISGSIAAYKAAEMARELIARGADVRAVLTSSARQFIAPLTLRELTGHPAVSDQFSSELDDPNYHTGLGRTADLVLIAPATANVIAKIAHGLADDLLTALVLATDAPVVIAPAMHEQMLHKAATQANLSLLRQRGYHLVGPERGPLMGADEGWGRLADVGLIVETVESVLETQGDYRGVRMLVTAGPTEEPIDPVRSIVNRSSGKMGYALAAEARRRGARVVLVSGPAGLPDPKGVEVVRVRTVDEMQKAVEDHFPRSDVLLMAAAPADYRPISPRNQKIKKQQRGKLQVEMEPTPDILDLVAGMKDGQVVVGFAAETQKLLAEARRKVKEKRLDLAVANDVSRSDIGFGSDFNEVTLVYASGETEELPKMEKRLLAREILDRVAGLVPTAGSGRLSAV